jgi:hypothetical protein
MATPVVTPEVPSSDRAAAAWDASADSAKAVPAVDTPAVIPAAQPAAAEPVDGSVSDVSDLLKDDLAVAADPFAELVKDKPELQERLTALTQAEQTLNQVNEVIGSLRYEIKDHNELKLQLTDAQHLYDIMHGKVPASVLLDVMMNNPEWKPEQKTAILQELADYIGKKTGKPVAAAAAGQDGLKDPVQARLDALEAERAREKQAIENEKFNKRVEAAKGTALTKLGELLKGSWLEGEGDYIFSAIGARLAGKEQQAIEAIERGDFKFLEKALREVRTDEAKRFKARMDRMIEQKKKKAGAIPAQVAAGTPAAGSQPEEAKPELDPEKRKAQMAAFLKS